ncbi:hypothetical protein [Cytobacillus firmus]|uniref:Uncharacterized protein n=1 Tax=Cytobacillus firmus DS1 TaxID=1307436 RepID=W7KRX7_CYTFI|nr:hypothetical protein [Cytobacillus firmus]EWG08878.1 hypothetical protein PBF_21978 [Cytobacillus firmus DS1]
MENGITAHIGGLKCDSPTCDYKDDSITLEQYESYIDAPCPDCGAPLLTLEDYNQVQKILSLVDLVNSLPEPTEDSKEKGKISFEFNGTGKVNVKIEKLDE